MVGTSQYVCESWVRAVGSAVPSPSSKPNAILHFVGLMAYLQPYLFI